MSCQSDPILLNPPGGYEYLKKSFPLNVEFSETVQGELHTGMSPRLYSGMLTNGDTVSTLICVLPQVLNSHQVCSADSIADVKMLLTSTIPIAVKDDDTTFIDTLIQLDALKAYIITSPDIAEDAVINSDELTLVSELISEVTSMPIELKTNNSLEINLFDLNNSIVDRWCDNQEELGILIDYSPTDTSNLEFYSSDSDIGPKLSLEYAVTEETSISYNCFSLTDIFWSGGSLDENDNGPHYDESVSYDYLDVINVYAFNLKENSPIPSPEMESYDALLFQNDIITSENLNSDISLFTINVSLNPDMEEVDSIITISLNYAYAFRSDADPSGDNKTDGNPDGVENNNQWDWHDDNENGLWDEGEGEIFNDFGIDNCPDIWETGNLDAPCDSTSVESTYNPDGTEGNGYLNWIDHNADGLWDDGEGETWFDVGIDGCTDALESGNGDCDGNDEALPDPNSDNYNIDPAEDDWNLGGTEGNGIWNLNEPYKDWGSDGLPASLLGYLDQNNTEGNGSYDIGEPFEDTGNDGLFNNEELGYNADGTEGNNSFDGDGEFDDCGEDNECDSGDDDVDPNNDNWNNTDLTLTEGNGKLDWTDGNADGLWDDGEGEQWFDWGLDQTQDSLETFQASAIISPNLYDNNYVYDIDVGLLQVSPELVDSTVNLWISKIENTGNNELAIDISVQTNVALKGLQFQLFHIPVTKVETELQSYEVSIAQIGTEKLFQDITLHPKKHYSKEELEGKLLIDFANDISTHLDFDSLHLFLENTEYILSHQYSNLVMYVDTVLTDILDDYVYVNITHTNSSGEEELLLQEPVLTSSDSIQINMGQILRRYQNGNIDIYNGLKLKLDGNHNNYSKLSIQYDPEQIDYNPRLEIMYTK